MIILRSSLSVLFLEQCQKESQIILSDQTTRELKTKQNISNSDDKDQDVVIVDPKEEDTSLGEPLDSDQSEIRLPIRPKNCRVNINDIGPEIPDEIAECGSNVKIEVETQ